MNFELIYDGKIEMKSNFKFEAVQGRDRYLTFSVITWKAIFLIMSIFL